MTESATRQQRGPGSGSARRHRPGELPRGAAGAALLLLVGGYVASLALYAGPDSILQPEAPLGLGVAFRMNVVMIAIVIYTVAASLIEFRTARSQLARLRALLDCDDATFAAAVAASIPTRIQLALALAGGGLVAGVMAWASAALISDLGASYPSELQEYWNVGLLFVMFPLLGMFALWGMRSAQLYSSLSRRYARVRLLDPEPLQLFATRGLRLALFWFGGSGVALLLLAGAKAPEVVLGGVALTSALGVASLMLPSLGVHQRLREAKAAELARVRGEIESRLGALRAGYSDGATELPALLAWEARVDQTPVWPLGGGVLIRFGLLVLIPVGSWLGGALVERIVDAALG